MKESSIYTVVDLFAGAGGLSCGFLQTGRFIITAAYENNIHARKTYKFNHPNTEVYPDVCSADYNELKEKFGHINVVIGGPPCQGFSNANRQKNHAISKNNTLVKQFVRAVVDLAPDAFVMENVSMLKSDTHKFFVDNEDTKKIIQYEIPTEATEIILLEKDFVFNGVQTIIESRNQIQEYIWPESDYLVLNIIYKIRKNKDKQKKALIKYKKKLLHLSERLLKEDAENNYITEQNHRAAYALIQYFDDKHYADNKIINEIEHAIMIQRMLGKVKELYDNNIVISHFSADGDLIAHVDSMTVLDYICCIVKAHGYTLDKDVLRAIEFGVPQKRERFVILGIRTECTKVELPKGYLAPSEYATVKDAIEDISDLIVGYDVAADKGIPLKKAPNYISPLGKKLRGNNTILYNHITTSSTDTAKSRFSALEQGENFHNLDPLLKTTYSDAERTQNTIYLRLKYNEPSGTVVNIRKSMWIHPLYNRALSIREAARLQTFPDDFKFCGPKDAQYQQIGNAVPPMLAQSIAKKVAELLDLEQKQSISEAI